MEDPYKTLGVKHTASADEIRKAYRQLARKYHPDMNPGDKTAEVKFKEIQAAYDLLGNAKNRQRYDRGEVDAEGRERGPFAGGGREKPSSEDFGGRHTNFGYSGGGDFSNIFSQIFGGGMRGGPQFGGRDFGDFAAPETNAEVTIDFLSAVKGSRQRIRLSPSKSLDINIPEGTEDGSVLRLRGQGEGGGDLLLKVHVNSHPFFKRDGNNILLDTPITLSEAVLGGTIRVPTLTGEVELRLPKWSNSGQVMRLRGKGIKGGDQLVTLHVTLPTQADAKLEKFVSEWKNNEYNPRVKFKS